MKIGVIGAGRLGICFALLCEKAGYDVLVSDVRESYVEKLNQRVISTNEPLVQELLKNSSKLSATTSNVEVINECDIVYTFVCTPSTPQGDYDVSSVWKVVEDFKNTGAGGTQFVVGCTTNPGDCDQFQDALLAQGVDVYYNPEFIAQGSIIKDLQYADMVLVGGDENHDIAKLYYDIQGDSEPRLFFMSRHAAELVKLAVNCYLTTKISYANMVGEVMALNDMEDEIDTVLGAIGADSRVGSKYLGYGYGFGGP